MYNDYIYRYAYMYVYWVQSVCKETLFYLIVHYNQIFILTWRERRRYSLPKKIKNHSCSFLRDIKTHFLHHFLGCYNLKRMFPWIPKRNEMPLTIKRNKMKIFSALTIVKLSRETLYYYEYMDQCVMILFFLSFKHFFSQFVEPSFPIRKTTRTT